MFLIGVLVGAGAGTGWPPAPGTSMGGHPVYGYSGYSSGGALYVNAFPSFAEGSLDGKPIGVANDLQASLVDTRAGVHALTVSAPGDRPTTLLVRGVRDWATRVRLPLIPTY